MNLTIIIISFGAIQGLFLSFLLMTSHRGNKKANRVLGVVIFMFSMSLGHVILEQTGAYRQYPHLLLLIYPTPFLFAPLILGYVTLLTRPDFKFKKKYLLHFLPFLLNVIFFTVTFYLKNGEYKIQRFEGLKVTVTPVDYFWSISHVIYTTPYLIAGVMMIKKHRQRIQNSFSSIEKVTLSWLQKFLYIIICVFVINTIFDILYFMNVNRFIGNPVMGVIVAVMIYSIGYMGWRQPEIFAHGELLESAEKYKTSPLGHEQAKKYKNRLMKIMKTDKPFLNHSLTIKELAERLNIPAYQLSQLINEHFGKNFFEFINSHRIEEAKQRLSDPKLSHYSILAIAYDAGFNSKSVFNTAFKKYTGMTPSEFRERFG
ncbi:hypothetical protein B6D60_02390 [candidate division KSB1 bacterium 4484_87]|nr:MAG: hypothetical protein B6D60_02390 [candidate division KSB1 bacterium 4484_87]